MHAYIPSFGIRHFDLTQSLNMQENNLNLSTKIAVKISTKFKAKEI